MSMPAFVRTANIIPVDLRRLYTPYSEGYTMFIQLHVNRRIVDQPQVCVRLIVAHQIDRRRARRECRHDLLRPPSRAESLQTKAKKLSSTMAHDEKRKQAFACQDQNQRRDRSQRWRPHDCAGMSASDGGTRE
jgi:hypothetical protein